jgi:hypothetical protein
MAADKEWIIWLNYGGGEIFLGLAAPASRVSRFCVLCTMKQDAFHLGVWVNVHEVQERTVPGNEVMKTFTVQPKTCLIPWNLIDYVQRGSRSEGIGFVLNKR